MSVEWLLLRRMRNVNVKTNLSSWGVRPKRTKCIRMEGSKIAIFAHVLYGQPLFNTSFDWAAAQAIFGCNKRFAIAYIHHSDYGLDVGFALNNSNINSMQDTCSFGSTTYCVVILHFIYRVVEQWTMNLRQTKLRHASSCHLHLALADNRYDWPWTSGFVPNTHLI